MFHYSPSTGGFYAVELHGDAMPADVVKVTAKKHAALIEAQAAGAKIVVGLKGPVAKFASASAYELRGRARRLVKREARRRILAIASLELQVNDAAAIAQAALELQLAGATSADFAPALERRRMIDEIRAASNAIELELAPIAAAELATFAPSSCSSWPTFEDARA